MLTIPRPTENCQFTEGMARIRSRTRRTILAWGVLVLLIAVGTVGAGVVAGLFFFSTGLHTYWINTLTTYYVTNQRLIKEYRFISLVRQELPFEKVRGVQERKSVWETLVGLGNVRVASGGGGTLEIVIRNIYHPTDFADEIRNLV